MALATKNDFEYVTDSGCLSLKIHVKDKEEKERAKSASCQSPYIGLVELHQHGLLCRSLVAELVGSLLLVLVGCGSCMGGDPAEPASALDDQANIVRIALCFGITVASLAQTIGHVSGCHINPAVTLGLVIGAKIGVIKGLLYIAAQCVGAICGAAILKTVVSQDEIRGAAGLGMTGLGHGISIGQAVAIEMLITAVLVMIVFAAAADQLNAPGVKGSAPLAIGLSITTCHLFAIPFTGSSMNPARSLGPAAVLGQFDNHWVYWVGPMLGAVIGSLFYQLVLRARPAAEAEAETVRPEARRGHEMSPEYQPSPGVTSTSPDVESQPDRARELVYIEDRRDNNN